METSEQWRLLKGVPGDLRALVGKREEKRSLQTRDPVEAERRHAEALAEIELRWANLRTGPKALTEIEAHQMAATIMIDGCSTTRIIRVVKLRSGPTLLIGCSLLPKLSRWITFAAEGF